MKQTPNDVFKRKSGEGRKTIDAQTVEQVVSRIRSQQWSVQAARDVVAWIMEENDVRI